MRQIYTIGETVYDIVFKNYKPIESRPGGAMLNTAISLGRLGLNVHLVADIASDVVGKIIETFLQENNVSSKYLSHYSSESAKSRLALAFLDEENNAEYSFYKIRTDEKAYLQIPDIQEDDIVLFGSFFGIKQEIRDDILQILKIAKERKAIIIYDPNFRKAHIPMKDQVIYYITENIMLSDIIKGSDEDFENIYDAKTAEEFFYIQRSMEQKKMIYTANKNGVWLNTADYKQYYKARQITTVSTIGAGDTFNAGIIYSLLDLNIRHKDLDNISNNQWDTIINNAIDFSTAVCMSYENYLDINFLKQRK